MSGQTSVEKLVDGQSQYGMGNIRNAQRVAAFESFLAYPLDYVWDMCGADNIPDIEHSYVEALYLMRRETPPGVNEGQTVTGVYGEDWPSILANTSVADWKNTLNAFVGLQHGKMDGHLGEFIRSWIEANEAEDDPNCIERALFTPQFWMAARAFELSIVRPEEGSSRVILEDPPNFEAVRAFVEKDEKMKSASSSCKGGIVFLSGGNPEYGKALGEVFAVDRPETAKEFVRKFAVRSIGNISSNELGLVSRETALQIYAELTYSSVDLVGHLLDGTYNPARNISELPTITRYEDFLVLKEVCRRLAKAKSSEEVQQIIAAKGEWHKWAEEQHDHSDEI
jgi:hypothetical protein